MSEKSAIRGPRGLINDIFPVTWINTARHRRRRRRRNVIADCKHTAAENVRIRTGVTRREIKSARFAMNKLSPAGIHSRRNLRGAALLAVEK